MGFEEAEKTMTKSFIAAQELLARKTALLWLWRHLTCNRPSLNHPRLRFRLAQHLTHGHGRSRGSLLSPGFQPLAGLFNVLEQVGILESGAPGGNDRAHAVPHDPDFSITLKKKIIVDQEVRCVGKEGRFRGSPYH